MAGKKAQRSPARKAKYERQFARTKANKLKNINKMKEQNPNWPAPKGV